MCHRKLKKWTTKKVCPHDSTCYLSFLWKQTKKGFTRLRNIFCKKHLSPATSETYTDSKRFIKISSACIIRLVPTRTKSFRIIFFPYCIFPCFSFLAYNLVILMNVELDMVLVIQSILCVHAELKLKLLNISPCVVNFTMLKD